MKVAEYKNDHTGNRQECRLFDTDHMISWGSWPAPKGRSMLAVSPAPGKVSGAKANAQIVAGEYGPKSSKEVMMSLDYEQMVALRDALQDAITQAEKQGTC